MHASRVSPLLYGASFQVEKKRKGALVVWFDILLLCYMMEGANTLLHSTPT